MSFNDDGQSTESNPPLDVSSSAARGTSTSLQEFNLLAALQEEQQTLMAVAEFTRQFEAQIPPPQSHYPADQTPSQAAPLISQSLIMTSVIKLSFEASLFRYLLRRQNHLLKRWAGELSRVTLSRFACGMLAGILIPLFLLNHQTPPVSNLTLSLINTILFIACLAGELLERYLFFSAVAAPRMPGVITKYSDGNRFRCLFLILQN